MRRCYRFVNEKNRKGRYVFLVTGILSATLAYAMAEGKTIEVEKLEFSVEAETKVTVEKNEFDVKSETEVATEEPEFDVKAETEVAVEETEFEVETEIEVLPKEERFSEYDIYLLYKITFAESRGECEDGQIAVANVVLNRIESDEFPNTMEGVIFDEKFGKQFEPTEDGEIWFTDEDNLWRPVTEQDITEKVKKSVDQALDGTDIAGKRLFFHKTNGREYDNQLVIGNHVFY